MQNNLSKQNFGVPASILCAIAYGLGYILFANHSITYVLFFTAAVFIFSFDEKVKTALKQAYCVGFLGMAINLLFTVVIGVLSWFTFDGMYKVIKVFDNISSGVDYVFYGLFAYLIFSSLQGKEVKIGFLKKVIGSEKVKCPSCSAEVDTDSAFCTKCGGKMK